MNPATIDWQTSLGVLVAGLVIGGFLLWRLRGAPASAVAADDRALDLRDLEAKRDALIRQLRELDDAAAKRTPEQLARERHDLEVAAARVLRELETRVPATAGAGPATGAGPGTIASPAAPDNAAARGFFWGVATATALAALVFFVNKVANPREEGGSLTGTAGPLNTPGGAAGPMSGGAAGGSDDIGARLENARAALNRQDLMSVWKDTQFVLERQPGHPLAMSYQALVRLAMGQAEVAEQMLRQAMQNAPDLLEPYIHLGVVYARTGRMAEAERTVRSAMSRFPDDREGLERLIVELRNIPPEEQIQPGDAHAGIAPPEGGAAHPPMETADGRPAAAPGMGGSADAAAGTPARLSGTVEVDPSARGRASGGLVFVTVRAAGVTGGPPVAVKRFPAAALPGTFAITSADSMLGQELPESVSIEARVDPDGDPLTRSDSDPKARLDGVKLGTTGLRLVLK